MSERFEDFKFMVLLGAVTLAGTALTALVG